MEEIERQILLTEYQQAQNSAQHHDNLQWTSMSIMTTAIIVLLGFAFSQIDHSTNKFFVALASEIGIILILITGLLVKMSNRAKKEKYDRCKQIEDQLGMRQHSAYKHVSNAGMMLLFSIGIILMTSCVILFFESINNLSSLEILVLIISFIIPFGVWVFVLIKQICLEVKN
ncbi:MAG: hypothetical protein APR63_09290 [Desulfuromonas sp. SDB]|nr:MAG: hypothetical protein APR63_09290 [Desulfuromonas sp. SDB]